ncbi:major facilitator superfamily domain-containing protein [Truncatella angustata]|uniref:Major facilitator superfamily domain-containing protein n=1 Tax=Truncatella angustata TaxID=152316 RepID=A0A9P8UIB9_9PEZI|nr:major facilitator superfamily domain-containing protein [Truncatella angustata]KAH6652634.1 major facilitator superfamily domain-containing protein [Truncatella angustata]
MASAVRLDRLEGVPLTKIPHWRLVYSQAGTTHNVINYCYPGSGTGDDQYIVHWIPDDPRNPKNFSTVKMWSVTFAVSMTTLAIALVSTVYSGGVTQIIAEFHVSGEVAILGVSLFVVGFAVSSLLWAPLTELFRRQSLLLLRFLAGTFGSSPLTNAGGVIADMFPASERGLATVIFAAAPFLGPVIGHNAGGFLGAAAGWRWIMGLLAAFSSIVWIIGSLTVPETYAPILLRLESMKVVLSRPWTLLFKEPIVSVLSIYVAIIYGTLYMLFAAFPIVYQRGRGWGQGVGALPFLGIMVGMLISIIYTVFSNNHYKKLQEQKGGIAPPEICLLPNGCICIPSVHYMASVAAGVPFGFGMVLVFLSIMNYLINSYTVFAASVLAANSVLRSLTGAAFPLFTTYMYNSLGIHWASSVPAFLALACVPFPFLFYIYGAAIPERCKYSAESTELATRLIQQDKNGFSTRAGPQAEPIMNPEASLSAVRK